MRILLTSDLHYIRHWFQWLLEQAELGTWDAICLGGDLLDMFSKTTSVSQQEIQVDDWLRRIAQAKTPVCVCSGNHDTFAADEHAIGKVSLYPANLDCITAQSLDGMTFSINETLLVTSCPWGFADWESLEKVSHSRHGRSWLILAHLPPANHTALLRRFLSGGMPEEWVETLHPTYLFSGHIHDLPAEVPFATRIANSWSLNAGQVSDLCSVPNYIELDTAGKTATWFCGDLSTYGMVSTRMILQ